MALTRFIQHKRILPSTRHAVRYCITAVALHHLVGCPNVRRILSILKHLKGKNSYYNLSVVPVLDFILWYQLEEKELWKYIVKLVLDSADVMCFITVFTGIKHIGLDERIIKSRITVLPLNLLFSFLLFEVFHMTISKTIPRSRVISVSS